MKRSVLLGVLLVSGVLSMAVAAYQRSEERRVGKECRL